MFLNGYIIGNQWCWYPQNVRGIKEDVEELVDAEDEVKCVLLLELVWYTNSCLSTTSVPEEYEPVNETALVQVEYTGLGLFGGRMGNCTRNFRKCAASLIFGRASLSG